MTPVAEQDQQHHAEPDAVRDEPGIEWWATNRSSQAIAA